MPLSAILDAMSGGRRSASAAICVAYVWLDARPFPAETVSREDGVVAMGMFALYTRPLAVADIVAGEAATKAAWGIP